MSFNWTEIETVLLDLDGTLLDLHFDNYFWQEYLPARWGAERGLDAAEARRILLPQFAQMEGTLEWYCPDYWTRALAIDVFALKQEIGHLIRLRTAAREFLDALAALGRIPVLVTNTHPSVVDLKLDRTGIRDRLRAIVSAHSFSHPKEHAGFWQGLHRHLPLRPERTLYIDDNFGALRTARAFGIVHLYTVLQPDSRRPPVDPAEFPGLHDFRELLGFPLDAFA
jgi:putative hydrolase of the HAD superfamily